MTSSRAKVFVIHVGHAIQAKTTDVISTKTSHATAAKAVHVTSTEATHVTSAEAAAAVSSATAAAAAAGLRTRGKKAAGKHCACQNHHYSSSHDILQSSWAAFPPQGQTLARLSKEEPTSRWTGDGNADLSSLLNSHSSGLSGILSFADVGDPKACPIRRHHGPNIGRLNRFLVESSRLPARLVLTAVCLLISPGYAVSWEVEYEQVGLSSRIR
jgi:hypothetical protein